MGCISKQGDNLREKIIDIGYEEETKMEMEKTVRFRNLSMPLKTAVVLGYITGGWIAMLFMIGVIQGMWAL